MAASRPLSRAEGFVRQSLAERFIHYTCIWDLRQAPNLDAMPVVGLMGMSLRQRSGNRITVVANPSYLDLATFVRVSMSDVFSPDFNRFARQMALCAKRSAR